MPLYRHRFTGSCAAGDVFSFSWWSDSTLSTDQANSAAATWVDTMWNGDGTNSGYGDSVTTDVSVTGVSTGEIDPSTGRQQTLAESSVTHAGVATGSAMPADVAIVVTLRSLLANRSGRGRFYLPQPAVSAATAVGRIQSTLQASLIAVLQSAWSTAVADGLTPVIYSPTYSDTRVISRFGIGDLFDTQRSRENALTETRQMESMP